MRQISKKIYFILLFIFLLITGITFYLNKDYYKNKILEKVYETVESKILFGESNIIFFPSPGLQLNDLEIENEAATLKVKTAFIYFSWKILYGNLIVDEIYLENGNVLVSKINENVNPTFDSQSIKKINSFLKLNNLSLLNFTIQNPSATIDKKELNISKFVLAHNHKNNIEIELILDSSLQINFDFDYEYGKEEFQTFELKSKITLDKFGLKILKEYYSVVKDQQFDNAEVSGFIEIEKLKNTKEIQIKTNLQIEKLKFFSTKYYPNLTVISDFNLNLEAKEIQFQNISVNFPQGAMARANGSLSFKKNIILNLSINGEYADIYKVVELIVNSVDTKLSGGPDFYSYMKINAKAAHFDKFDFTDINLELNIYNTEVQLKIINASLLDGKIFGIGKIRASKKTTYEFDLILSDINSEELLKKYTDKSYIKGSLGSVLKFNSSGNDFNLFLDNFQSTGFVEIRKGELLGYANFMKPIFSLGKLINFTGPKGKNTEFQSLKMNYSIQNKIIQIPNLKMIGVGIDAKGNGKINFDRKIDFKINVSLGGLAGKILFVPILYKGVMPDNISYIDPFWLGSVYIGSTFLAGPIGTTVGGIAGSAVSEYATKAWDGMKKLFTFEKKPNE